ncbi:hypothetical protein CSW98_11025 [Vibrio sp. HA2012]|uniref:hypothetical protein n=1 Tax=Vibrio sp. HA2012 TaxID=1971595 RepID=UPI000C2BCC93|nr:hypothetical protein [Vibrio sp. HA2012]PJC86097.1 hypothetical protein CSW98_11025 [Vibrio sp. HA2012]
MRQIITAIIFVALLSGCAEHIAERKGAEIQIVPVAYTLGISIKNGKQDKAREQLDKYTKSHWDKVTTQMVNLTWYTPAGKKLADSYYRYLLGQGLDENKLAVKEAVAGADEKPFDMKFETIVNRAVVEVCAYEKVGNFGRNQEGCYSDGARWQSMVNPEKMLRDGK